MKTKLIAIGNIIVIIFFISRIRIKMHLKFFLMKITMKSAYAKYFYGELLSQFVLLKISNS